MNNIITGASYFLSGFSLITKSGIKRFVIIPFVINLFLFVGLLFLLKHYMGEFNAWFAHFLPAWLQWFSVILWVLFFVGFFLIFIYLFVIIGNIVAAPFNSFLAEKVELYLTGQAPIGQTFFENIKDLPRIIGRQFSIIIYFSPRAILLLILFFIPIVQVIAAPLWFLFNAWFLTLTYIDYPTDNNRVPLLKVREWLRERQFTALGFGAAALVATMIPVVNFIVIPVAVAAATKFWVEEKTLQS